MSGLDDPGRAVFQADLDAALDRMVDGLEAKGYRVPSFAFAFDAQLPDGSRVWGSRVSGYSGEEGAQALVEAGVRVLREAG
jgi:hypothetical protein